MTLIGEGTLDKGLERVLGLDANSSSDALTIGVFKKLF